MIRLILPFLWVGLGPTVSFDDGITALQRSGSTVQVPCTNDERKVHVVIRDQTTLLILNVLELFAQLGTGRNSRVIQGTVSGEEAGLFLCLPVGSTAALRARILEADFAVGTVVPADSGTLEFALTPPTSWLRGVVEDRASGLPVSQASVRIQNSSLQTQTGFDGRFNFGEVPVGNLTLVVEAVGYGGTSGSVAVRGDDLEVTLQLSHSVAVLAPIVVRAFSLRLDRADFYERERRGTGIFLDRGRIEALRATNTADLLRRIPSVRIETGGVRSTVITGRGQCAFTFIVDGSRTLQSFELESLSVHAIEGIEVYRSGAEVPAVFRPFVVRDPRGGNCGVVVIWTRDRFGR
jgi:hypothetical protein